MPTVGAALGGHLGLDGPPGLHGRRTSCDPITGPVAASTTGPAGRMTGSRRVGIKGPPGACRKRSSSPQGAATERLWNETGRAHDLRLHGRYWARTSDPQLVELVLSN